MCMQLEWGVLLHTHTHTHIHFEKYLQMHASGLTVAGWKISTFRPTLTDTLIIFAIYTLPADFFFFFLLRIEKMISVGKKLFE